MELQGRWFLVEPREVGLQTKVERWVQMLEVEPGDPLEWAELVT